MKTACTLTAVAMILTFPLGSLHAELQWETNYQKALNRAAAENKAVVMDFTGSDWCHWCMKLDKEILATPSFRQYAASNLVLLKVDFPSKTPIAADLKKQNADLKNQYKVMGFPTLVILNPAGTEVDRIVGFLPVKDGPETLIARLQKFHPPRVTTYKQY